MKKPKINVAHRRYLIAASYLDEPFTAQQLTKQLERTRVVTDTLKVMEAKGLVVSERVSYRKVLWKLTDEAWLAIY